MADEQKGTEYVVLRQVPLGGSDGTEEGPGSGVAWEEIGRARGANDLAAIRAVVTEDDPIDDDCVAVPVRSWRPRRPQNKTIMRRLWT